MNDNNDPNNTDYQQPGQTMSGSNRGRGETVEGEATRSVRPLALGELSESLGAKRIPSPGAAGVAGAPGLSGLGEIPIELILEVGRTDISIKQLMELKEGSYVSLKNVAVDTIDVRVGEEMIAQGEAISLQHRFAIRIRDVQLQAGLDKD